MELRLGYMEAISVFRMNCTKSINTLRKIYNFFITAGGTYGKIVKVTL